MKSSAKKVELAPYDDLFSTEESRQDAKLEKVREIPLSELHPFKNHPFKVKDDEAMMETADSVRQYGVLVPAIARPDPEGGYELVAGHRRHRASELAEKETMPVIVRDLDDDAATIIMVDSNLQRESLLPSERAFAYKMKLEAIYRQFLQGKSTNAIATMLTEEGIPTPGKKTVWQRATVESILRNEKYKGSALLQKSFTVDFLTKKTKINEGEVPQYYVEDSHPAIIEPWEWEQVQVEMERRKNSRNRHHQTSPFSGKIICADCGDIFGTKTWHSTDRYRRVIWQCNDKFKGEHKCETPHLTEERLKELFLSALGAYLSDRETVITRLRDTQRVLTDTDFIDEDIRPLEENLTTITGKLRLCITENAANTVTEETYRTAHADLCRRFEETEARLTSLQKQRDRMKADAIAIGGMMFELGELDALPVDFDEKLWQGTIDHVTVHADERVVFRFKDGKEIATRL